VAKQRKQRADHRADLRGKPFVGLPAAVLYSAAYEDLSLWARAILVELLGRFHGYNNGAIGFSFRDLANRLGTSSLKSIGPAIIELLEHGFIDVVAEGRWKSRQARLYRLTFISTGKPGQHHPATNDYVSWTPTEKKSRVPHTVTRKPRTVPQTVTGPLSAVPHTVTEKPISSVWGSSEPVTLRGTLIGKPSPGSFSGEHSPPSNTDGLIAAYSCERCAEPFTPAGRGKPKRFCSEKCRKAEETRRRTERQRAAA
jgi:hypothetical protein